MNIKGLINKEYLDKQIEVNQDEYGSACVNVAINVMKYLDSFDKEFNIGYHPDMTTPHGIICECDDQGGITGFMAGAARNIVAICHELGWKFYLADVISSYDVDDDQRINEKIENILNCKDLTLNEQEVRDYVKDLIKRYKDNI